MKQFFGSCLLVALCSWAMGAEITPIAKPGKSLFKETFGSPEFSKTWKKGAGDFSITEGVLSIKEKASDMHVAAIRALVPVKDASIRLQFQLDGAKVFHVGFDPAPGELKGRVGHLFNVVIDSKGVMIQKAPDKQNKSIKAKMLAKTVNTIEDKQWHELVVHLKGTKVQAIIDQKIVVEASDEEFAIKKPGVVFRAGGETVLVKNLEIFEVE